MFFSPVINRGRRLPKFQKAYHDRLITIHLVIYILVRMHYHESGININLNQGKRLLKRGLNTEVDMNGQIHYDE
jgi:hypothetical protein